MATSAYILLTIGFDLSNSNNTPALNLGVAASYGGDNIPVNQNNPQGYASGTQNVNLGSIRTAPDMSANELARLGIASAIDYASVTWGATLKSKDILITGFQNG